MSEEKKATEWRILQGRKESFIPDITFAAPVGKEINESMVEQIDLAISMSALLAERARSAKLVAALEHIYEGDASCESCTTAEREFGESLGHVYAIADEALAAHHESETKEKT